MKLIEDDILLRIFIDESAKADGKPLYEQILLQAKELGISGATVIKGIMGFGADKRIRTEKILDLSLDMPLIIEIIDTPEKIKKIKPYLDSHVQNGFMTEEHVHVVRYR
jgi:PII-like signaling protein